jgi:hypothetical protein
MTAEPTVATAAVRVRQNATTRIAHGVVVVVDFVALVSDSHITEHWLISLFQITTESR